MKPLTGRKVLAIWCCCFGVIISVNLVLAFQAVRSFPGLEVANSYVASQYFNDHLAEHRALGWEVAAKVEDGILVLSFTDANGTPVEVAALQATLGRATHIREDREPDWRYFGGVFTAPAKDLAPGNWNIRLVATAPDGSQFRQRVVLHHREG